MDDKSHKDTTVEDLQLVEEHARTIIDRIVHLKENPHKIMTANDDVKDIVENIGKIDDMVDQALEDAEKYRTEEFDNPVCQRCGTAKEVAVTSSNITGYLCPECDI